MSQPLNGSLHAYVAMKGQYVVYERASKEEESLFLDTPTEVNGAIVTRLKKILEDLERSM